MYQNRHSVFREELESALGKARFKPAEVFAIANTAEHCIDEYNLARARAMLDIPATLGLIAARQGVDVDTARQLVVADAGVMFDVHDVPRAATKPAPASPAAPVQRRRARPSFDRVELLESLKACIQDTRRAPNLLQAITHGPLAARGLTWAEADDIATRWPGEASTTIEALIRRENLLPRPSYLVPAKAARTIADADDTDSPAVERSAAPPPPRTWPAGAMDFPRQAPPSRSLLPPARSDQAAPATPAVVKAAAPPLPAKAVAGRRSVAPAHITRDDVVASIRATVEATGRKPRAHEAIEHGPLANNRRTWHAANVVMSRWPGAAKTSFVKLMEAEGIAIPGKPDPRAATKSTRDPAPVPGRAPTPAAASLSAVRTDRVAPARAAGPGHKVGFTRAEVVESLRLTVAAIGRGPQIADLIEHGPLANGRRTWNSANVTMHGWPQAERTSCAKLLISEGLAPHAKPRPVRKVVKPKAAPGFTRADVVESLTATVRAIAARPRPDAVISHGPLADGKRTWADANRAMQQWGAKSRITVAELFRSAKLEQLVIDVGFPPNCQENIDDGLAARTLFNRAARYILAHAALPSPRRAVHNMDGLTARRANDMLLDGKVSGLTRLCNGQSDRLECLRDFLVATGLAISSGLDAVPAPREAILNLAARPT